MKCAAGRDRSTGASRCRLNSCEGEGRRRRYRITELAPLARARVCAACLSLRIGGRVGRLRHELWGRAQEPGGMRNMNCGRERVQVQP